VAVTGKRVTAFVVLGLVMASKTKSRATARPNVSLYMSNFDEVF